MCPHMTFNFRLCSRPSFLNYQLAYNHYFFLCFAHIYDVSKHKEYELSTDDQVQTIAGLLP